MSELFAEMGVAEIALLAVSGLLLVVLAVFAMIAAGWHTREQQARAQEVDRALRLEDAVGRVTAAQSELAGRLSAIAEATSTGQSNLAKSLEARFDSVRQHLGASLSEQAQKTTESLTQLQTRLAVIDAAQKNITELSGQVVGLQEILSNKQARGAFGEIQMADLVRQTLPPSAFTLQAGLSNGKRADCLIRLPHPPGPIVIDSKFPLEPYEALQKADDPRRKADAARALKTAVRAHIRAIAERYILEGETADSALMFVPSEAVMSML